MTTSPTVCNMCFWQCAATLYQEDDRPWKVVGHPDDPHCDGRLCTRGTGGIGAYLDPDRLRQPLLRVTRVAARRFKPVSWDEAFEFIAGKMQTIGEQHGKDRIALFSHGDGGDSFPPHAAGFRLPCLCASFVRAVSRPEGHGLRPDLRRGRRFTGSNRHGQLPMHRADRFAHRREPAQRPGADPQPGARCRHDADHRGPPLLGRRVQIAGIGCRSSPAPISRYCLPG